MKRVDVRSSLGGLLSCGLAVGLLAFAIKAQAAQIDLTNCQPQQVRICAYDDDIQSPSGEVVAGKHILSDGESGHYTCHANCKFWISDPCSNGKCADCGAITYGRWLDHSWGKGSYQLISLAKTGSGGGQSSYKSSDLQKVDPGTQCP